MIICETEPKAVAPEARCDRAPSVLFGEFLVEAGTRVTLGDIDLGYHRKHESPHLEGMCRVFLPSDTSGIRCKVTERGWCELLQEDRLFGVRPETLR
jgi:hypothetical protein